MGCRIFIENPPPFKQAPRGERRALVTVPIEEGVEAARFYLDLPLRLAGLHHSDLDRYEVKRRGGITPSERYDSFDYVHVLGGDRFVASRRRGTWLASRARPRQ